MSISPLGRKSCEGGSLVYVFRALSPGLQTAPGEQQVLISILDALATVIRQEIKGNQIGKTFTICK